MNANPYSQYRDVQIQTASPGRLLVMLYDGAIRFLVQAKTGIETKNPQLTHQGLTRVQDILDYLVATLNMDAGEVASNLASLYDFMGRRLLDANLHRDPRAVADVIGLVETLRNAYAQVALPATGAKPGSAPVTGARPAVSTLG